MPDRLGSADMCVYISDGNILHLYPRRGKSVNMETATL